MKKLLLPSLIVATSCFLLACAVGRTNNGNTDAKDTLGIGFNTSGINRSVPPPVGQNHPLGSVGLDSRALAAAPVTEIDLNKVPDQTLPSSGSRGLENWEAANMNTDQFINSAYQSGIREIAFGKLALKNASKTEVKTFAELLIKDHSTANKQLEKMARDKNITLIPELKEGDIIDLKGEGVDEKYLLHVLESHRAKIGIYEKAQTSTDVAIREFSLKQLPQLKNHLSKALYLNNNLKRE